MNFFRTTLILATLFFSSVVFLSAQTNDNILWASFKLQKKVTKKTTLALAPIVRLNQGLSNYQNMSIDYSVKHKFNKHWTGMLLGRTWFLPSGRKRQFLWVDLTYGSKISNIKFDNRIRLHYAFTINDRKDGDFLRFKSSLTFLNNKKLKPHIAIEPWLQLNEPYRLQRFRLEPGVKYQINDAFTVNLVYRREETIEIDPSVNFNMYVATWIWTL